MAMKGIQTLIRKTLPSFLPSILKKEELSSPSKRGEKTSTWYDASYVYLTPQNNTNTLKENNAVFLHFEAKSMMKDYTKFLSTMATLLVI